MKTFKLAAAILTLCFAQATWAELTLLSITMQTCQKDIADLCPNVKPGEGRLMNCLFSKGNQVSIECEDALRTASTNMEQYQGQWAVVMSACEADYETYCPTVKAGDGRILDCLTKKANYSDAGGTVSKGCLRALEDIGLK